MEEHLGGVHLALGERGKLRRAGRERLVGIRRAAPLGHRLAPALALLQALGLLLEPLVQEGREGHVRQRVAAVLHGEAPEQRPRHRRHRGVHVALQERKLPPARSVRARVQGVALGHVVPPRRIPLRAIARSRESRVLGLLCFLCLLVFRIRLGVVRRVRFFVVSLRRSLRRDARLAEIVVVVGVDESLDVVVLLALARLPHGIPVRGLLLQELGDQHERAARERRGRVRRHLQKPLHHRRGARRPRVVLERAEGEAEQLTRRPRAASGRARVQKHGVQRAVEAVGDGRARAEELQQQRERLERAAQVGRVRDGEERRRYFFHQRFHGVAVHVRKRAVDPGEERRHDPRVHAGAHGRGRRARDAVVRHSAGFCALLNTTASAASAATAATAAPPAASASAALGGAVAPPVLLVARGLSGHSLALLVQTLPAPFVQGLEQGEVKLHELRGEALSVRRVRERELVEEHGGVVLRLEAYAFAETERLHLPGDHLFHRGVLFRHQLQQQMRGVARGAPLRVAQFVNEHSEKRSFVLGAAL